MTDLSFIVKMVIYKCREKENPVTETLAAYVAQTTLNECKSTLVNPWAFMIFTMIFLETGRFYLES